MKKLVRALLVIVLVAVAAGVLAFRMGWLALEVPGGTAPGPPAREPSATPHVIVASTPTPSPVPTRDSKILRVAVDERGASLLFLALPAWLKNHGNDLEISCVVVPDAAVRWQLLSAGRVDLACGTLDSFVLAESRAPTGAIIFKAAQSKGLDILVGREAESVEALAKKRIAMVRGEGGAFLLGFFLDAHKMLPSQVQMIDVSDPRDALQLLESGRVQAACLWPPYSTRALALKGAKALADTGSHPMLDEVCAVNATTLERRKSEVVRLMAAWFELEAQLATNVGWGSEMLARETRRPPAEVSDVLSRIRLYTLGENQAMESSQVATEMSHLQDFWRVVGAPNAGNKIDFERAVRIDLTRAIDLPTPSSIYGTSPSPSPESASPSKGKGGSPLDESANPQASPSVDASADPTTTSDGEAPSDGSTSDPDQESSPDADSSGSP
jgi:ABC-type nitrate/sulfonate/bicarbonate transport system substrate-binding protein